MIYLDNNSTTPIHSLVKEAVIGALEVYGNPSNLHKESREAKKAIEQAREKIASFIEAKSNEIVFTGSGSEASNAVFHSAPDWYQGDGKPHVIISEIEHPCVLEGSKQYDVTRIPVGMDGVIDLKVLEDSITPDTVLISIMLANNEIGTIQPIEEIVGIAKEHGVLVHTDAVQALGKIPVNVQELGVDFASFSGHKIYAPKGVGVLYIKNGVKIKSLIVGGHQEKGRRAGTENVLGIVAFGRAVEILGEEMEENNTRIEKLRNMLREGIVEQIPNIIINGDQERILPNTLSVTFKGVEGESILLALDLEDVAVSTGSACSVVSLTPSHVIKALGVSEQEVHGTVRFSLGRQNTEEEIHYVLSKLPGIIQKLRDISSI